MRFAVIVLACLVVATPLALAHGPPPPTIYDPLTFQVNTWLTAGGALTRTSNPPEGSIAMDPVAPGGTPPAYVWKTQIDFGFKPRLAFTYRLFFRFDSPCVCVDPQNEQSIGIGIAKNGKLVDGSLKTLSFGTNLYKPGDIFATGPLGVSASGVEFQRGDSVGLYLVNDVPGLQSSFSLLWGGAKYNSTFDLEAITALSIDEMRYENAGYPHFLLEGFNFQPPAGSVALAIDVKHDFVYYNTTTVPAGSPAYLVFRGSEPPLQAQSNHHFVDKEKRDAAAHYFNVQPGGKEFGLYPGEVVIVPLNVSTPQNVTISCTKNCPSPGWKDTVVFGGPTPSSPTAGGTAGPSPTDASAAKKTPDVALPGLLAGVAVSALIVARRKGH